MIKLKLAFLSLCLFTLASCQSSRVEVGGIPGVVVNSKKTTSASKDKPAGDSRAFKFPRQRGQVKFRVPLEKNFKESPSSNFNLVPKTDSTKAVPTAIDHFSHDWNRESRVRRLVH